MKVILYDTTLRDGSQAEEISFTVEDKLHIARALDDFGVEYVEGGWPGSNPKDLEFFSQIRKTPLKNAKICAFGSTARADVRPEDDDNIQKMLAANTPVVTVVGKSWDLHVTEALRIDLPKNLKLIEDSLAYLKSHGKEIMFDAEHFFDGYRENPEYALSTLGAALKGGADVLVLCDTNGGSMPDYIYDTVKTVQERFPHAALGIHCHNDCDLAVANSLAAIRAGATQVQGTMNGFGERCGNANLVSIIPNVMFKLGLECLPPNKAAQLRQMSRFVDELANRTPSKHQPFVGDSAFAHKGGIHVSAIRRNRLTYEHIDPTLVGNHQRILVSDLSGRANVIEKIKELGFIIDDKHPAVNQVLEELKRLENEGYSYEGADGSFEILVKKRLGTHRKFFKLLGFRVIDEKRADDEPPLAEATIMLENEDGAIEHTASMGHGPVNALDSALRKALEKFYPAIRDVHLTDFKVRVITVGGGTESRVRVLIESTDGVETWVTVGVSENIIQASYTALVDSIEYKLLRDEERMLNATP